MSVQGDPDEGGDTAPFPRQHHIPTIAKYRKEQQARQERAKNHAGSHVGHVPGQREEKQSSQQGEQTQAHEDNGPRLDEDGHDSEHGGLEDTSEATLPTGDAKQRRHHFKNAKDERAERQVTDPVTHLPIDIQDLTSQALKDVPENDPPFGSTSRSSTGVQNKDKSSTDLQNELQELQHVHDSSKAHFPPPSHDFVKKEIMSVVAFGVAVGLSGAAVISIFVFHTTGSFTINPGKELYTALAISSLTAGVAITLLSLAVQFWLRKRVDRVWDEQIWEVSRESDLAPARAHETETTAWLNSLLGSVWPLVNPDLFLSVADTLEDVMQASLPKMVQMVSVNDIGQGSEAIRILGIRWLPSGAAARSVNKDGSLKAPKDNAHVKGDGDPSQTANEGDNGQDAQTEQEEDGSQTQIDGGMAAEEGDFVNVEVAFAYRARSGKSSMRDRANHMHLHMAFYLPGNVKVPVWVDLRGIVGTMRLRLQLCPDPPFFSMCTMTFLGQPKVDISCTPLAKHAINIMDVPLISNFVQSAVDAAMAEYVAPKSLNLDLKDMLEGDGFKKDTHARGILVVRIIRGYDFEDGDPGIPLIKKGSSDPYVSVGWAKFGKPVWSTRIMLDEMEPVWNETAYLLVTPEELNVRERLRVQLWDSDRLTADDDLGRVEVDLHELMHNPQSKGKMWSRNDGFRALKAGESMPGKLEWSVGYFAKAGIQQCQLQKQTFDTNVRTLQQLEENVDSICDRKLREARIKKGRHSRDGDELEQQKKQEMKSRQDSMIISAPPPDEMPSGIFSIQIHSITGLELENLNNDYSGHEQEEGEGLPSAYCTVVINHQTVFRTRTKPKSARPFYNAGTERFLRNWRSAEVFVAVRDARISEDDALLGIVHLSLGEIFKERSQVNGFYPISGGAGFGRMRISMVWRSVHLQAPPEALGWDIGTIEAQSSVSMTGVPEDLRSLNIRLSTDIGTGKMYSSKSDESWNTKKGRALRLPVRSRYPACLTVQFRQHAILGDKTVAYAVFWLRDIPDDEEQEVALPVWKGDFARARKCALDDCGEKVGSLTLKLKFWSGLGGAHSKWASKRPTVRNVVEILDTARDNHEHMENEKRAGIVDDDSSSSSDDDDDDASETDGNDDEEDDDDSESQEANGDKPGPIDRMKARLDHEKSLNRRHRGIMQWRAPRTAQWAINKIERTGAKIPNKLQHHARQQGVEAEV